MPKTYPATVASDFGLDSSIEVAAAKMREHYGLRIHCTTIRRATLRQGEHAEEAASLQAFERSAPVPARNANALLALRLQRANGPWDEHWREAA